jgi:hypothetical protein
MGWDANVKAVWSFEGSGADLIGSYDLTAIGTPTNVNEGDAKLGNYTNKLTTVNNLYRLSDAFITYASGLSAFTIEGWDKRGTATGGLWDIVFLAGWLDSANGFGLGTNTSSNNAEFNVKGTHPPFAIGVTQGDWYFWSIEWTGTQANCYINGTLKSTINTTTNPFSGLGYNIGIGQSTLYNNLNTATRHDKFIFSDIVRGGVETLPFSEPTITDISPNTGTTAGGTAVTITGTEFATGATVTFDGVSATSITVVSATEITCVTPAHVAGAVDVVVTNTDTGTVTSAGGFTYVSSGKAGIRYGFVCGGNPRVKIGGTI